ncbi:uncharacterized protein RSE6_01006 [Rhynchosporium secalis]|uniref:AHC1-like C2H2 zinc-finger domain-containing protein n=1 Tax=Rhynchosporium secalis TaxID=38038 RepID=A0A1E1LWQ8_RHYSE|nr:uncharacterized protein RSE6_01006 [Rhynchosporium secalis]
MANATRPVVEITAAGLGKRRMSSLDEGMSGMEETDVPEAKRSKPSSVTSEPVMDLNGEETVNTTPEFVDSRSQIRDAIDSQFSLEILLKHNELRLINQELAKCQAALEQLRRCHLIPFPPTVPNPVSSEDVSNGTGPAVGYGDRVPQWAPPFGVTDGPYSRHYTKWLIPDPKFDGVVVESSEGSRAGKSVPDARSTRNSFNEGSTFSSKSRSYRGTASQKLQALPSGYPPVKEKAGPCVLKRGDGVMVKLICIDCQRHDFSSTQGFINHCRISHRRDFKSHEEAAVACGHPAEFDEAGHLIGEERAPSLAPGVHPMVRSAPYDKAAYSALLSRIHSSMDACKRSSPSGTTSMPSPPVPPNANFVPSASTPHLSALMRSRGFGGNLEELVHEAKTQVTFEEYHESDSSDEEQVNIGKQPMGFDGTNSPPPVVRMPARPGVLPGPLGRPSSSKGIDGRLGRQPGMSGISSRVFHETPVIDTTSQARPSCRFSDSHFDGTGHDMDIEMLDGSSIIELSPNTVACNNAPSLVSDDGEYDEGDDAASTSSADEDEDSDVAEINIDDDSMEKVIPRTVLRDRAGSIIKKEDKHVSFVSPVKEAGRDKRSRNS